MIEIGPFRYLRYKNIRIGWANKFFPLYAYHCFESEALDGFYLIKNKWLKLGPIQIVWW